MWHKKDRPKNFFTKQKNSKIKILLFFVFAVFFILTYGVVLDVYGAEVEVAYDGDLASILAYDAIYYRDKPHPIQKH